MNPEHLVNGVLSSVLGVRGKQSGRALRYLTRGVSHVARDATRIATGASRGGGFFTRPSTLIGALGLAWGIFETLQNQNQAPPQNQNTNAWGTPAAPVQGAA